MITVGNSSVQDVFVGNDKVKSIWLGDTKVYMSSIEDKVPYNYRISGGGLDIGNQMTDTVVGGTLAWNQLLNPAKFDASDADFVDGVKFTNNGDGSIKVEVQETHNALRYFYLADALSTMPAHALYGGNIGVTGLAVVNYYNNQRYSDRIAKCDRNGTNQFRPRLNVATSCPAGTYVVKPVLFDLTLKFESTIADYILSLETATAGAGVAWFRKLFPKSYYAYNAGTLMSVNTSSHNTVGFNQWDEEWEVGSYDQTTGAKSYNANCIRGKNKIRVIPNQQYCFFNGAGTTTYVYWYDGNENYLTYNTYLNKGMATVPSNAVYMTFRVNAAYGTTYNNDICINLHSSRDGEYKPYVKHEYPLDSSLELRGIPKLDADNKLYYDGDTYESDGRVTRKYGIVDLGTLTWSVVNGVFYGNVPNCKKYFNGIIPNYIRVIDDYSRLIDGSKTWTSNGGAGTSVWIKDTTYPTATALKTSLSGVYLVYELATPTTETAQPFTNPQIVSKGGTEEYVDYGESMGTRDVAIPVGHNTIYAT